MSTTAVEQDLALAATLDRQAHAHGAASEKALRERRAVWLRLHEEHGLTYVQLQDRTNYGSTTIWKELRKAREERISG